MAAPIMQSDEVRKAHPSLRFFTMHPDLGLAERESEWPNAPAARELSVRWLALSAEEQELRKCDMLRALLERAAAVSGARFQAMEPFDEAVAAALRTLPSAEEAERSSGGRRLVRPLEEGRPAGRADAGVVGAGAGAARGGGRNAAAPA